MRKKADIIVELQDLKAQRKQLIEERENMHGIGLQNDVGYTHYDVLGDFIDDIESIIEDLEKELGGMA